MTPEEFRSLHRGSKLELEGRVWIVTDTDSVKDVAPGTVVIIPFEEVTLNAEQAANCHLLSE